MNLLHNKIIKATFLFMTVLLLLCGCKQDVEVTNNPNSLPKPIEVGNKYYAEITSNFAETFNGDTIDDTSLASNNYLPKGTVDYCSESVIYNPSVQRSYRLLKHGRRIYEGDAEIKQGVLADSNSIYLDDVKRDGKYTFLYFISDWKAPFVFNVVRLGQQNAYIQITFCYCNDYSGLLTFSDDHPLFSKSEIIENGDSVTLKIYLKNKDSFYGWRADYDESERLVFRFLEPTTVYTADNEYGKALYDATVLIDAGHGGKDVGATGGGMHESVYNLELAIVLKDEFEKIGAKALKVRCSAL